MASSCAPPLSTRQTFLEGLHVEPTDLLCQIETLDHSTTTIYDAQLLV